MKKLLMLGATFFAVAANASYDDAGFKKEIRDGLDVRVAEEATEDAPYGELGADVYPFLNTVDPNDMVLNTPNTMYIRGGAGAGLGFASGVLKTDSQEKQMSGGWTAQMGLGWNLSSYVRTEIDFQSRTFGFSGISSATAHAKNFGGTLYFDLARRYIRTGDITRRRFVVPFIGFGAGAGVYNFEGDGGASGAFIAPRAIFGINFVLNDLIGIDLSYQYQMFVNDGFGWNTDDSSGKSISDVLISLRMNF